MGLNIYLLILVVIMATLDTFMMVSIKKYYIGNITMGYGILIPMIVYSLQPLLFYNAMAYEGIGVYNVLWDSLSNIFVLVAGIMIFSERITIKKYIGIVLSFIGILLMMNEQT